MKLLILHLSDMHFKAEKNYNRENIEGIVNALRPSVKDVIYLLIVISGDISFSGHEVQFSVAKDFLETLRTVITTTFQIGNIAFALVPGNHDVNYNVGEFTHKDLIEIDREDCYEDFLMFEMDKQGAFLKFSQSFDCFPNNTLLHQKYLSIAENKILLNLINTAVFSSREEDQGYHYFSDNDLVTLQQQNKADFVFTIMHHPCGWFNRRISDNMETILLEKSDLIFLGHKHYETTRVVSDLQNSVHILAGGMLSNCGNWDNSEFHIGILDFESREFQTKNYQWEKKEKVYVEKNTNMFMLSKDRFNSLGLTVRKDYQDSCINQDTFYLTNTFMNYFVFPLLEEQKDESKHAPVYIIDNMSNFLKILERNPKILISGRSDSGKTALAKAIFCALSAQKVVLFLNGSDVRKNAEQTIKNVFEDIYGRNSIDYERFKQSDPASLALIIDDVDSIQPSYRDGFINYINDHFGFIIEMCQLDIELDIIKRIKQIHDRKSFLVFRIEPFYANKRQELVTKIVEIIGKKEQNYESIIHLLCATLSKQKTLYNWSPSFIVQFTNYYYNNIGEATQKEGNVFSKVFESNLVTLIKPYAKPKMPVEKIFIVLDKIAYDIFRYKKYPISTTELCEIVKEYNERFDAIINPIPFVNDLVNAKILKQSEEGYLFSERTYLAYFIARELNRRIQSGDFRDIKHVIEYAYIHIYADILLFVTYISDNLSIVKMLMEQAESITKDWEEFSVQPVNISYLSRAGNIEIKPVVEEDRKKEEQKHIEVEKEEIKNLSLNNDATIFDGETEDLNFIQEMMRCIALMTTLARALPSFEHIMEKEEKAESVSLLYTLPLRIFFRWAKEVDIVHSELVQMIKDFHEWQYRKDKLEDNIKSDFDALQILQWESTSLLLELMNASFGYSVKENTWRFLDRFEYTNAPTYGIEHLIGIGHMDNVEAFVAEALRLYDDNNEEQAQLMVKRIVRNFLLTSKSIKFDAVQQLITRLFGKQLNHKQLLLEQVRNKQKE